MITYDNYFKWKCGHINSRELDELDRYFENDIAITREAAKNCINALYGCSNTLLLPGIVKVIFNDPATIVIWEDGSKTVVKCDCESFDPEKGLAMAISKKALGNIGNYYETFKTWLPEQPKAVDILKDMYRSKPKKRRR